jgi:hypothetical protein
MHGVSLKMTALNKICLHNSKSFKSLANKLREYTNFKYSHSLIENENRFKQRKHLKKNSIIDKKKP